MSVHSTNYLAACPWQSSGGRSCYHPFAECGNRQQEVPGSLVVMPPESEHIAMKCTLPTSLSQGSRLWTPLPTATRFPHLSRLLKQPLLHDVWRGQAPSQHLGGSLWTTSFLGPRLCLPPRWTLPGSQ